MSVLTNNFISKMASIYFTTPSNSPSGLFSFQAVSSIFFAVRSLSGKLHNSIHFKVKYLHFLVSNFKLAGNSLKQNKPRVRSYQKNVIFHRGKKTIHFIYSKCLYKQLCCKAGLNLFVTNISQEKPASFDKCKLQNAKTKNCFEGFSIE